MDEQIRKYFQGELDATERLKLLRQVESDHKLKEQFIEYKNMYALLSLSNEVNVKKQIRTDTFASILKSKQEKLDDYY